MKVKEGILYPGHLKSKWSLPSWQKDIPMYPRYVSWKNGIYRKSPPIYRYCPPCDLELRIKRYDCHLHLSEICIKVTQIPPLFLGKFSRHQNMNNLPTTVAMLFDCLTTHLGPQPEGVNIPEIFTIDIDTKLLYIFSHMFILRKTLKFPRWRPYLFCRTRWFSGFCFCLTKDGH